MRKAIAALGAMLACTWMAQAQEGHHHELTEQEVGSVHFATTCSAGMSEEARRELDTSFNKAVALLHSFQYESTRSAFEAIAKKNPNCAMAEWGIAMSHYHGLWKSGDVAAGRSAISKAQEIANTNAATSAREKAYIGALADVYAENKTDYMVRGAAFEKKMGEVAAAYPSDTEAQIFHAISLKISASPMDKTFSNEKKCGEILEPIFKQQPHHPGVAHYIIHCYDNPVLAEQGLDAARLYAKIAPASAHANHMPSHIFTRVGSWEESISSNIRSAEIAKADEAKSKNGEARDQRLHAMDYLEYAYLQTGQVKQAKTILDELGALDAVQGMTLTGNYAEGAIPARYTIELRLWKEASELKPLTQGVPWSQALVWEAIGEGSARAGNLERAKEAEAKLAELRDEATKANSYWSKQIEVQRREVSAWIAAGSGKKEEALEKMRGAAELEESMDKDAVTPGAVTPAREMLAYLLEDQKRDKEALAEYEAVLKVAPKRFNALYGAAVTANRLGNSSAALRYFRELTEVAKREERPEVETARARLIEMAKSGNTIRE
jgi:tetratricopeptide (TPR) repeat protein